VAKALIEVVHTLEVRYKLSSVFVGNGRIVDTSSLGNSSLSLPPKLDNWSSDVNLAEVSYLNHHFQNLVNAITHPSAPMSFSFVRAGHYFQSSNVICACQIDAFFAERHFINAVCGEKPIAGAFLVCTDEGDSWKVQRPTLWDTIGTDMLLPNFMTPPGHQATRSMV
jgi:hypothetical protein